MAFGTASEIFSDFIADALNNGVAFNLAGDTHKVALFTNTATPNQDESNAAFDVGAWDNANEVFNGGWAAGGVTLTTVTAASTTGVFKFDADDAANSTAATLSAVRGCLVYDTTVSNRAISYHSFGSSDQAVSSGTFTVVWNSSGILTLTL